MINLLSKISNTALIHLLRLHMVLIVHISLSFLWLLAAVHTRLNGSNREAIGVLTNILRLGEALIIICILLHRIEKVQVSCLIIIVHQIGELSWSLPILVILHGLSI